MPLILSIIVCSTSSGCSFLRFCPTDMDGKDCVDEENGVIGAGLSEKELDCVLPGDTGPEIPTLVDHYKNKQG